MSETAADGESGPARSTGSDSGDTAMLTNEHLTLTAGDRGHGRWLRRFALASVIATFALIVLGGIVRVTGSGMGCGGEWPLCSGGLLPPMTAADIIEYSHRLVASAIVGPLILITFLIALFRYRRLRFVLIPAAVSVVLLLAQGGLGGVTVLTELPGHIVAAHLALAQALFACLILIAVSAYRVRAADLAPASAATPGSDPLSRTGLAASDASPVHQPTDTEGAGRFPLLAAVAAVATYVLLLSGAYVTATPGALAACPQWPLCEGSSLWPSTTLQTIHMLHRAVAAVVGILLLYTFYRGYRLGRRGMVSGGIVLLLLASFGAVLFLVQVFIGAVAVWTHFPVELRAYHIALATAVWGIMVAIALVSRLPQDDSQVVPQKGIVVPGSEASSAAPEAT